MTNGHDKADESADTVVPAHGDAGNTFIEVLVSLVLLGTAGIAVLVAIAAALRGASTHDDLATVQASLADAGDHLMDVTYDDSLPGDPVYVACASPGTYQPEVDPWGVVVTSVRYWQGGASPGWVSAPCAGDEMQEITLRSTVNDTSRQLVVTKRKATVAITPGGEWNDNMVTPEPHSSLP